MTCHECERLSDKLQVIEFALDHGRVTEVMVTVARNQLIRHKAYCEERNE